MEWKLSPRIREAAAVYKPKSNAEVNQLVKQISEIATLDKHGFAPLVCALRTVLQNLDKEYSR